MSMMVPVIKANVDQVVSRSDKYNLSVKLNTDGVAIFRSSHGSIQNIVDRVGTVVTVLKELTNVCWR